MKSNFLKKLCIYGLTAMHVASPLSIHAANKDSVKFQHSQQVKDELENEKNTFKKADEAIVFIKNTAAKDAPLDSSEVVENFKQGDEATLTGTNEYSNWKIEKDGKTYYVNQHSFETKEAIAKREEEAKRKEEEKKQAEEAKKQEEKEAALRTNWNGPVLTPSAGAIQGPTGKETYYNLPMEGVVSIMRSMGNNDPYWVREDGVKMLGDYVMVAANLSMFPRGSYVPCSLGMAIVCDTGGFAAGNPTQLDIATAW